MQIKGNLTAMTSPPSESKQKFCQACDVSQGFRCQRASVGTQLSSAQNTVDRES